MLSLLALAALGSSLPLAPSGKWVVEYDENMCVLSRNFGEGKDKITVALRPYPMGTSTEVIVITPGGSAEKRQAKAELTLLPAGRVARGTFNRYKVPKLEGRLSLLMLDQDALQGIDASTGLEISLGEHESYKVELPGIAPAMRALGVCQKDLLKTWGIDPSEQALVATPPTGNPAKYFGPDAYPAQAVAAGEQGRVVAVTIVSETGDVKSCSVVTSSHSPSLDKTTCDILRRAHFSPGRDGAGKAVTAHVVVPVNWVMP